MSGGEALILAGMLIAVAVTIIGMACEKEHERDRYHEGWHDRAMLEAACEMSPDDDAVLKEMKRAWKAYLRAQCMYRKGDSSKVDVTSNFREFKDVVWETMVRRKELNR